MLLPTRIAADGTFGGAGARPVGGIVALTEFDDRSENETKRGVFALSRPGAPGAATAICDAVRP